ncbi:MAG: hypothetical protein AABW89_03940 [Nanoarchaeota archaeon]
MLKRKALGICGVVGVKSGDELAGLLVRSGIEYCVEDARRRLPYFRDVLVEYSSSRGLQFRKIPEGYRIEKVMLKDEAFYEKI